MLALEDRQFARWQISGLLGGVRQNEDREHHACDIVNYT
jgi:hypothetical protein